jgi:hypothetical protein
MVIVRDVAGRNAPPSRLQRTANMVAGVWLCVNNAQGTTGFRTLVQDGGSTRGFTTGVHQGGSHGGSGRGFIPGVHAEGSRERALGKRFVDRAS